MSKGIPKPSPEYLEFLTPYDRGIVELALATRALVLEEAGDCVELLYDAYNAVAAGYSYTGKPSESFIHVAVYARWVNLGFNRGAELKDPRKLLKGEGRSIRHIRIAQLDDLEAPHIRYFVRAATSLAKKAPASGAKSRSVVRAIYPKRRRPEARPD